MKLIGLSGTNGAGKDSVGHLLAKRYGFLFVSVTDMLRDECRTRNLPVTRENLRAISSEWRREGGLGVLVDKAIEVFNREPGKYQGLILASLRNPGEPDRVHELGGSVVWVDADVQVRYARVTAGGRGRGEEDTKTFEQFLAEQEAEMHGIPGDPTSLKMSAVKEKSDIFIQNDSDSMEAFEVEITKALAEQGLI